MCKYLYAAVLMVCNYVTYSFYFALIPSSTDGVSVDTNCEIFLFSICVVFSLSVQSAFMAPLKVKVKANFILEQATKAQRGSRGIALLFLQPRR